MWRAFLTIVEELPAADPPSMRKKVASRPRESHVSTFDGIFVESESEAEARGYDG